MNSRTTFLRGVVFFVLTTVNIVPCVNGIVDYCAENTFKSNSTWLQFTKEISSKEYAISNKFKSLHCCVKGYRSIEWYKDGKAYPWPAGVSNLILYPESANQTIYSQTLDQSDGGNYSCIVSNDTHQHLHTIHLNVIDATGYTGSPLPTYEPRDHFVELGGEARLFCEAFVGRIDLPDAHNEVSWRRGDVNSSFTHLRRFQQASMPREDDQILGSYLLIRGVKREDYGLYVCRISNTWFQAAEFPIWLRETDITMGPLGDRMAYKKILLVLGVVFLASLTLVAVYLRFGLTMRRALKDNFAKLEIDDDKVYDAVVCYSENDSEFVLGVLVPTLESRYNYRCCAQQFTQPHTTWAASLGPSAEKSRRLIAILSPSVVQGKWTSDNLTQTLSTLLTLHSYVTCIALQALPKLTSVKNDSGESLPLLLRKVNVISWDNEERFNGPFWASLRLRLPARRVVTAGCSNGTAMEEKPTTSLKHQPNHATSNESLEILV